MHPLSASTGGYARTLRELVRMAVFDETALVKHIDRQVEVGAVNGDEAARLRADVGRAMARWNIHASNGDSAWFLVRFTEREADPDDGIVGAAISWGTSLEEAVDLARGLAPCFSDCEARGHQLRGHAVPPAEWRDRPLSETDLRELGNLERRFDA
jgi:hypothetical protein